MTISHNEHLLRLAEVTLHTGVSRSTLYAMI
jgi:predicted DNA-binding transcriptional regulator AlpA